MTTITDTHALRTEQQLIFTFTTGRSGTALLTELFKLLPEDLVMATHEPQPVFDDFLWRARITPEIYKKFWTRKLSVINKHKQPVYIETSHIACKGFLDGLLDLNVPFDIIYLYRPIRDVATSMYRLNDIPGKTNKGIRYYLLPGDRHNCLQLPNSEKNTDYQLCYWYCLELWERAKEFYHLSICKESHKAYFITLADLKKRSFFSSMLRHLNLPELSEEAWKAHKHVCNLKVNCKRNRKSSRPIPDYTTEEGEINESVRTQIR